MSAKMETSMGMQRDEMGLTGWGGSLLRRLWRWRRRREAATDWVGRILKTNIRSARRKFLVRRAVAWVKRGWKP